MSNNVNYNKRVSRGLHYQDTILDHLEDNMNKIGKKLEKLGRDFWHTWDAFAPMGVDIVSDKPTYIEIKYFTQANVQSTTLKQFFSVIRSCLRNELYIDAQFLLITNLEKDVVEKHISRLVGVGWNKELNLLVLGEKEIGYVKKETSTYGYDSNTTQPELIYSYIVNYRNIKETEINFSSKFVVKYHNDMVEVQRKTDFGIIYPEHITNLNAIVGKNGAGKTNLCDFISGNFRDESKYFSVYHDKGVFYVYGNINPFENKKDGIIQKQSFYKFQCEVVLNRLQIIDNDIKTSFSVIYYKKSVKALGIKSVHKRSLFKTVLIDDKKTLPSDRVDFLRKIVLGTYQFENMFRLDSYIVQIQIEDHTKSLKTDGNHYLSNETIEHMKGCFIFNLIKTVLKSMNIDQKLLDLLTKDLEISGHFDEDKITSFLDKLLMRLGEEKFIQSQYSNLIKMKNAIMTLKAEVMVNEIRIGINSTMSNSEFQQVMVLLEQINNLNIRFDLISNEIMYLTDGETSILNQFSGLYKAYKRLGEKSCILVLDEPETSMHPEFSRKFIDLLFGFLKEFDVYSQVIVSTHSPFILSDIIKGNVVYISNDKKFSISLNNQNTFAANINEMLIPSLFMSSTIGEFAQKKINEIIEYIKNRLNHENDDNYIQLVECIDDSILRRILKNEIKSRKIEQC